MNSPAPAPVAGPRPAPTGSVPAWTKPAPAQPARGGTPDYRRQGSRRRLRADLVDVVLTVLVVIPVAVFIAQDGLAMMTTFPGFIKAVGIVAGLVAMAMLLEMLLLSG